MTDSQIKLTASIKELAFTNYELGGDCIIECMDDNDILEHFDSIEDARQFMTDTFEHRSEIESTIW